MFMLLNCACLGVLAAGAQAGAAARDPGLAWLDDGCLMGFWL